MSDAPERTFVQWPHVNGAGLAFSCQSRPPARRTEYIRADIHAAEIAALHARAEAAEAALAAERAGLLNDPAAVHINMLRGTIAKPTVEQIVHLYGREAFQPMIDAAIAQALEKACVAVSEHANWPEDEHGRTEQVGLFARVINAIRAIAALPADRIETDAAEIAKLQARNAALVEALEWYAEQSRLARLIHSEGDAGRYAIQNDGGKKARAAITAARAGTSDLRIQSGDSARL